MLTVFHLFQNNCEVASYYQNTVGNTVRANVVIQYIFTEKAEEMRLNKWSYSTSVYVPVY